MASETPEQETKELSRFSRFRKATEPHFATLKRLSPILLLVGAILSFADPITDILTLVEFYRTDHKTWFAVGLTFVSLPCMVFPIFYWLGRDDQKFKEYSATRKWIQIFLCGCNPFSAALAHLEGFVLFLKKCCSNNDDDSDEEDVHARAGLLVLVESILESAPQTILQLYAMSVQNEPVEIIQIISLPVSFLSLARAFILLDEITYNIIVHEDLKVKHKVLLFVTHLFVLIMSSRLFAIAYFTVGYKWWVIGVLLFHTFVIAAVSIFKGCKYSFEFGFASIVFFYIYWISDVVLRLGEGVTGLKRMQLVSQVLFVVENIVMILLYFLSDQSNTWYSLPVTVCVCVFSVIGAIMRVPHYHVLFKECVVPEKIHTPTAEGHGNSKG